MPGHEAAGEVATLDGQMTVGDARTLNDAGAKSKDSSRSGGLDTIVEYRGPVWQFWVFCAGMPGSSAESSVNSDRERGRRIADLID